MKFGSKPTEEEIKKYRRDVFEGIKRFSEDNTEFGPDYLILDLKRAKLYEKLTK